MNWWPKQPLLVVGGFALLISIPELAPKGFEWRAFDWGRVPAVLDFQPAAPSPASVAESGAPPDATTLKVVRERIADPDHEMDHFYAALLRAEKGEREAVRILHYGDSPTTADMISADTRMLLQERFGDAGHGTHLVAKPWAWYAHRGLEVSSEGWQAFPATTRREKDGQYGVAGVSFRGWAGAWTELKMRRAGHTRVSVRYWAQPGGGVLTLRSGDMALGEIDTKGDQTAAMETSLAFPADATRLRLQVSRGQVRISSVELERDAPGVVYSSLGLNGTWMGVLAFYMNGAHWSQQLKAAKPDLVILNYGTNESGYPDYVQTTYSKDLGIVLKRIKAAVPEASVLVMSPMDRGARQRGGQIGTIAGLPQVVALQSKLAAETGCAFFNTFEAMGGPGTMGRWFTSEPRLVSADFIHPMPQGARIVGTLLYQALLEGFNRYKLREMRQQVAGKPTRSGS